MKILLLIASLGLLTTAFNISNDANAHNGESTFPHVDSRFEFPHTRWATVRQTIQIHVPHSSQALAQLSIDVPANVQFQTSRIQITDGNHPISAPIVWQDRRLQINFDRPIAPDTELSINFNGVQRNMLVTSPVYYVYGKTVDGANIYLGEAYFPQAD
jgi:hypothetical protein